MGRLSEVVWAEILAYLRLHYADLVRPGFTALECHDPQRGVLAIHVGDEQLCRHLDHHCRAAFAAAGQAATGHLVSVEFILDESIGANGHAARQAIADPTLPLNPHYLFDHFVTGPENRLAHASCRGVAESPGKAYNPLFIHGSSGLGKTHLLQAICHEVLTANPQTKVVYLSCETFVNHFIETIERGDLYEFRHRYRDADLLAVDDVQFIGPRERSQEEFFHTFNTLYQSQRQIVLSADSAPAEIAGLAERLMGRFQWGLVVRLDPLCVETRIAILRTKARVKGIAIPEDVLDYIGTAVRGNARELEGALAHVKAYGNMLGTTITVEMARHALAGDVAPPESAEVNLPRILAAVTERFGVKLSELRGPRRHRSIVLARQTCMYLARRMTPHSLEEIGAYFGGRDHSTVLHAKKKIEKRCAHDEKLRGMVGAIEQQLLQN